MFVPSADPGTALAVNQSLLGDHPIHRDVMIVQRDVWHDLALKGHADEHRFNPYAGQQTVVKSATMPQPPPVRVEGDTRNHDQIQFRRGNRTIRSATDFGTRFQDAECPGDRSSHPRKSNRCRSSPTQ